MCQDVLEVLDFSELTIDGLIYFKVDQLFFRSFLKYYLEIYNFKVEDDDEEKILSGFGGQGPSKEHSYFQPSSIFWYEQEESSTTLLHRK